LGGNQLVSRVVPKLRGLPQYGRVIPRIILDKLLLDAACKEGVVFRECLKATALRINQNGVELEVDGPEAKRTLRARLLIGADGSNSTIARIIGGPPSISDRIVAIRGYFEKVDGLSNQADLHFDAESFPGYCWLFPTGKNEANVGVGVVLDTIPTGSRLDELLNDLIRNNKALNKRLKNAKLVGRIGGWPLTTYNPNKPLIDNRVILVGDAAGLVNPLNGEGIQNALLSGRWASETAINSLQKNDLSTVSLLTYQQTVNKELGYGMSLAALIVQLIKNRTLNPLWLRSIELMAARSKADPDYADIVGGILMGTIAQSESTNIEVLRGTIEQAISLTGLEFIENPASAVKSSMETIQTVVDMTIQATQNPSAFFDWAVKSLANAINFAAVSTNHAKGSKD
jgi:menaquinone-9 beta-reductase